MAILHGGRSGSCCTASEQVAKRRMCSRTAGNSLLTDAHASAPTLGGSREPAGEPDVRLTAARDSHYQIRLVIERTGLAA